MCLNPDLKIIPENCKTCAHKTEQYWITCQTFVIECKTDEGSMERRFFHAFDTTWCPRWKQAEEEK